MDIEKKAAKGGFDSDGLKKGHSASTKGKRRTNKRSAKAAITKLLLKEANEAK